ncbi:MAG: GNAT family N-acetyltransferase [Candidatus Hydrogenedentota bacterium]
MSYTIKRANSDDLDAVAHLFDGYRVFYEQASDIDRARNFMEERLRLEDSVVFLVVEDDTGRALGFVQLYPLFSSVSTQRSWLLNDLFVAEAGRKQGVGEALMQRAEDHARETGTIGLILNTAHTNTTAQRLYERMGYKLDTVFRTYRRFF